MWRWFACGKHPSVKDYFTTGTSTPMGVALSEWIAKGYQSLPAGNHSPGCYMSWRFWAGGSGKDTFLCGIVRDSSDSIGRPYPMLMLGTGPLSNWEAQWHLAPYVCEKTWNQMEAISTRTFHGLGQLEEEILRTKPPEPNWTDFARMEEEMTQVGSSSHQIDTRVLQERAMAVRNEGEIFIPIDEYPLQDHLKIIHLWLLFLKRSMPDIPKAVFMGGDQLRTFLVVFRRPLSTRDFNRIWSACSTRAQEVEAS
jgi:type VI secretion system protein VasJ